AGAVRERGVTFSLSPEIEKELTATGAFKVLLDAVREKAVVAVVPKATPAPVATPVPTPTPPGFDFYQTRADANFGKGEFTLALADYDKAVSLKSDSPIAFLNRGRTHFSLKDFGKATADFDKSIELDPKDAKAYFNRGVLNESLGYLEKAFADYSKAAELDPANQAAKTGAAKIDTELKARAAKAAAAAQPVKAPEVVKPPESVNVGLLTAANATRMAKPVYSTMAQRSNIEGRVLVEIELDTEGNVVQAKAVSGHQFLRGAAEDAAKKSKFKPAMYGGNPIKGFGTIVYNFTLRAGN
ncbi:MAG: TonB family protein, partial [Acidobacteria bacterium]|nr:TonB family protein [Acidobacteriota bacterium]